VWFASGLSLRDWVGPVLRCAVPVSMIVAALTLVASPWAYRQILEYQQRYQNRSDVSKIRAGQFIETNDGTRVFFANAPDQPGTDLGRVIARVISPEWVSIFTARSATIENKPNGDRFLVLGPGSRYDIKPGKPDFRLFDFKKYGFRLESKGNVSAAQARAQAERKFKAQPTSMLLHDSRRAALGQLMWRLSLPLAVLNLALLALPLGAANPRLGRSGHWLIAGLVGLLYMNLMNLSQGWIESGSLGFWEGFGLVHGAFFALMMYMMWRKLRIKAPRAPKPEY
jgi:lipopolysaccharide export system permease protein